jgi:hypothetical protein
MANYRFEKYSPRGAATTMTTRTTTPSFQSSRRSRMYTEKVIYGI